MQHQEVCTNLFPASKLNSMAPRHTFPACRLSVQSGRLSVQTAGRSGVKLAGWLAKNMSDELNLPDSRDEWSSADLNNILIHCLVSNRRGDNLHTFQCVEFESDLYRGVMRARYFPFDMENHRFYGKNVQVKVRRHSNCIQSKI